MSVLEKYYQGFRVRLKDCLYDKLADIRFTHEIK